MSGADIKTLINNTLVEYITTKKTLVDDDFIKVINEMHFETIGKKWNTPDKILSVLVHEVGHSIVGGALTGNYGEISAIRYGDIGGSTCFDDCLYDDVEEDEDDIERENQNMEAIIDSIIISFGGMASEKVLLNEKSIGVCSDFNGVSNRLSFLFDNGCYGFKYSFDILRGTEQTSKLRRNKGNHLCNKFLKEACKIIKKNRALAIHLINEVHKNDDAMSSNKVKRSVQYFFEHKKELTKKYKNIDIRNMLAKE